MKSKIKNLKKSLNSFFASLLVSAIVFYGFYSLQKEEISSQSNIDRFVALNNLNIVSNDIEQEIKNAISYTEFFSLIISQNPTIEANNLEKFASLSLENNKNIKSVQFAPNGVVSIVYPYIGNEAAIGHDLLNDPKRKEYAQKAIEKKVSILQGPIVAKQGGYLIFNRKAIFYEENNIEKLWGLAVVAMDFEKIVNSFKTKINNDKYLISIRTKNKDNIEHLFGEQSIFTKNAIFRNIDFPENSWEIALYPKNGWADEQSIFSQFNKLFYFANIIIFTLLFFVFKNYFSSQERSKKDPLTNTLNKSAIKKVVNKRIFSKKSFVFIIIDINGFKDINDNLGHYIGDCVLIELSNRFDNALREKDYVSRFGGDEFIICLNNQKSDVRYSDIIERIKNASKKPMQIENYLFEISISIGYSQFPKDAKNYNDLYKLADKNMYENKQATRSSKSKYKLL